MKLEDQGPLRQSNAGLGHCIAEENKPVRLGCGARNTAQHPHPPALPSNFPGHVHFGFLGYLTKLQQHLFILQKGTCLFPEDGKQYHWSMLGLWTSQWDNCPMKNASNSVFVTGYAHG